MSQSLPSPAASATLTRVHRGGLARKIAAAVHRAPRPARAASIAPASAAAKQAQKAMSEDNSQYDGRKALITGITGQDGRYARGKAHAASPGCRARRLHRARPASPPAR